MLTMLLMMLPPFAAASDVDDGDAAARASVQRCVRACVRGKFFADLRFLLSLLIPIFLSPPPFIRLCCCCRYAGIDALPNAAMSRYEACAGVQITP